MSLAAAGGEAPLSDGLNFTLPPKLHRQFGQGAGSQGLSNLGKHPVACADPNAPHQNGWR